VRAFVEVEDDRAGLLVLELIVEFDFERDGDEGVFLREEVDVEDDELKDDLRDGADVREGFSFSSSGTRPYMLRSGD